MRILVIGPEHSGTRWVLGLLKIHPDVTDIKHISYPYGGDGDYHWAGLTYYINNGYKIVIVCRDRTCNLKAMESYSEANNHKDEILRDTGAKNIFQAAMLKLMEQVRQHDPKNFTVVSYESLISYKALTLRQTFRLLGLPEDAYDYGRTGQVTHDWFTVDLNPADGNEKYI